MKISVIVPCWNVERWLDRSLDEIFIALPADAEVIAVDDGSDDNTLSRLNSRAKIDARLKVIASTHRGVSAARNIALDAARGEYIFFVDPDDGVEEDFFSAMIERLERDNADYCVCAFNYRTGMKNDLTANRLKGDYRYSSHDEIVSRYLPRIFGYSFDDIRAWYKGKSLFTDREMAGVWRGIFKRAIIEANQLRFDEEIELFEDAMFTADYLIKAKAMTSHERALYRCTRRDDGAMTSIPKDASRLCRNKLALLRHRERLDDNEGGQLYPIFAASCVLALLEVLRYRKFGVAREMLKSRRVCEALRGFPLSWRHPFFAMCVLALRIVSFTKKKEDK